MPTIDPPQPTGGEYPLSALVPSTIEVFTGSEDYQTKTGSAPPPFNALLPLKFWIDKSVKAASNFTLITYTTIHLDPSGQTPIVTPVPIPGFLASSVNIPPDSGTGSNPSDAAGTFLVPSRPLLANEKPIPREGGLIDIVNTDIYDPTKPANSGDGFNANDRGLLTAIANRILVGTA